MPNVVFSSLLVVFGLVYYRASTQIPSNMLEDPVGASGFPRMLALVITGLSAISLVQALLAMRRAADGPVSAAPPLAEVARKHLPTLILLVTLIVFLMVFDWLGYILAVSAMLLAVFVQTGIRLAWQPVVIAILGSLGFWVAFGAILGVRLPAGLLPPLF